jgi:glucose/arabinose dehydrogenase
MRALPLATLAAILIAGVPLAGCNKIGSHGAGSSGDPVESRPPNAPDQEPAFPEQTRAPFRTTDVEFDVRVVASGLEHPWGLAFLPDGEMLVTERPGRLRIVAADGTLGPAVTGLPAVDARDQGGLLDVVLDPDFANNARIYWSYAEPRDDGNGTAVARGRLVREGAPRIEGMQVIWRMTPTLDSTMHFGGRMVFQSINALFITTGERSILDGRRQAQQLGSALGKVIRIHPDGSSPEDNPLIGRNDALPEIWSWGHRNLQGARAAPGYRRAVGHRSRAEGRRRDQCGRKGEGLWLADDHVWHRIHGRTGRRRPSPRWTAWSSRSTTGILRSPPPGRRSMTPTCSPNGRAACSSAPSPASTSRG